MFVKLRIWIWCKK